MELLEDEQLAAAALICTKRKNAMLAMVVGQQLGVCYPNMHCSHNAIWQPMFAFGAALSYLQGSLAQLKLDDLEKEILEGKEILLKCSQNVHKGGMLQNDVDVLLKLLKRTQDTEDPLHSLLQNNRSYVFNVESIRTKLKEGIATMEELVNQWKQTGTAKAVRTRHAEEQKCDHDTTPPTQYKPTYLAMLGEPRRKHAKVGTN